MTIVNTVLPIFLIIFLGTILKASGFVPESFFKHSNRLIYWIGLPCLLFIKTAQVTVHGGRANRLTIILIIGMTVCTLIAYALAWLLRLTRRETGTFVQGAFRSNLFYVGLPVVLFALSGSLTPELEALAVMVIAPMTILYNIVSVLVLLAGAHQKDPGRRLGIVVLNLVGNPLLLAVIAGIGFSFTGWPIPAFVERTLTTVGQMSLPLVLLGIGATLTLSAFKSGLKTSLTAALIKVAVAPAVGYVIGTRIGLAATELQIILLYLACPTAVVSTVMAEQLNGDYNLACNIVVISTLLSFPALAVVMLIT